MSIATFDCFENGERIAFRVDALMSVAAARRLAKRGAYPAPRHDGAVFDQVVSKLSQASSCSAGHASVSILRSPIDDPAYDDSKPMQTMSIVDKPRRMTASSSSEFASLLCYCLQELSKDDSKRDIMDTLARFGVHASNDLVILAMHKCAAMVPVAPVAYPYPCAMSVTDTDDTESRHHYLDSDYFESADDASLISFRSD